MEAKYTPNIMYKGNPFVEALPPMLSQQELLSKICSLPEVHPEYRELPPEQRLELTARVLDVFLPMHYAPDIYSSIYNGIKRSFSSQNSLAAVRQINAIYAARNGFTEPVPVLSSQTTGFSVLGVPGIGKTTTVSRILDLIPKYITHTEYNGVPFIETQINHIHVQCPGDCSIKSLCCYILSEIDFTLREFAKVNVFPERYNSTIDSLILKISQLCLTYHIGVIVIDEIQNIIPRTKKKADDLLPLAQQFINSLVHLMNNTGVCIVLVGTPEAEEYFEKKAHLFRRTRGERLDALNYGKAYNTLLNCLWEYQYTKKETSLTESISKLIYELSGGIPALMSQILMYAQQEAILSGREIVDEQTLLAAAKKYSIKRIAGEVPNPCDNNSLVWEDCEMLAEKKFNGVSSGSTDAIATVRPTFICEAKQKGRPRNLRSKEDLLELRESSESTQAFIDALKDWGRLVYLG